MSKIPLPQRAIRWLPLVVLFLGLALFAETAEAQSRERSRSSKKERVEKRQSSDRSRAGSQTSKRSEPKQRTQRSRGDSQRTKVQVQKRSRQERSQARERRAPKQRTERARTSDRGREERSRARTSDRATQQRTERSRATQQRTERSRATSRDDRNRNSRTVERRRQGAPDRSVNQRIDGRRSRASRDDRNRNSRNVEQDRTRRNQAPRSGVRRDRRYDRDGNRGDRQVRDRRDQRYDRQDRYSRNDRYGRRQIERGVKHRRPQRSYRHRDYYYHYIGGQYYRNKYRYHKRYRPRPRHVGVNIHIDLRWPWQYRHRRHWAPRYRYRQVVYIEAGWGAGYRHHRRAQLDVRTVYRHYVRSATPSYAEIDIFVDALEIYQDGQYVGTVDYIPENLGRIRATVYRDGRARFDRDVFLVGDPRGGLELISTRHYDDFVLSAYERSHGVQVGTVDLYRGRVVSTGYSRFFDPYNFDGYVPVSLLPDNTAWLFDYGQESVSASLYDGHYRDEYYEDDYYYGSEDAGGDDYFEEYGDDDYFEGEDDYNGPRTWLQGNTSTGVKPLVRATNRSYETSFGAQVRLKRETELLRIE